MTTATITQPKISKKQAKFVLHEAKLKASEIYAQRRRQIENEFNASIRPLRNTFNDRKSQLKKEYYEKLEPIIQQFDNDAKPIFDLRITQNEQVKKEYRQNVIKIKTDYLERENHK